MKDHAELKETDMKNCTYYLDNLIDTNDIDFRNIKSNKKSHA